MLPAGRVDVSEKDNLHYRGKGRTRDWDANGREKKQLECFSVNSLCTEAQCLSYFLIVRVYVDAL